MLIRYLTGATTARLADEMSAPAVLLLGLAAYRDAGRAALVFGALTVAAAAGGPVLGALLDRARRPGHFIATCLVGYAVGLAGTAWLVSAADVAATLALAGAAGLVAPALAGGWTSLLPDVVPGAGTRAVALDAATFDVAALAGPAATAAVALTLGPGAAVAVATALLCGAAVLALRLPVRRPAGRGGSALRDLRAGLLAVASIGPLRRMTLASCVAYAGSTMVVVACPLLGAAYLGGAGRGTLLLTLLAAASLVALGVLARRSGAAVAERAFATSSAVSAFAVGGLAVAATWSGGVAVGLVLGSVALLGLAAGPQFAAVLNVRHREAPPGLRGQVFTTGASLKITSGALGGVAAGALAGHSLPLLLAVAAAAQLVAVLIVGTRTVSPVVKISLSREA